MAKGGFQGARMGGMNMNMIKQAQKMREEMMRMQQEVEAKEFTASAGGGMVTVTANGRHEILKLDIDPDAVIDAEAAEDVEMLADAILAAVNEVLRKSNEEMASNMSKVTGGMGLGL